jgi:hypothetical protein
MSEPTLALLLSAAILLFLALFVPCIDALAALLRRAKLSRQPAAQPQSDRSYTRDAA